MDREDAARLHAYGILIKLMGGLIAVLLTVSGFLVMRNVSNVDDIERRVARLETRQSVTEVVANEVNRRINEMNGKLDQLLMLDGKGR